MEGQFTDDTKNDKQQPTVNKQPQSKIFSYNQLRYYLRIKISVGMFVHTVMVQFGTLM